MCVFGEERVATGAGNTAPLMPMMSTERDLGGDWRANQRGVAWSRGHACREDDLCLSMTLCVCL
jgi:hypothetical protein